MFKRVLFLMFMTLFAAGIVSAQPPSITSGVNWLIANQSSDKSWGDPSALVAQFTATAEVLDALRVNGNSGTSYQDGFNWLQAQSLDSTESAARRLRLGAQATAIVPDDLNRLVLLRNSIDGSWGIDGDYLSDVLDTSLALQALKATNYSNTDDINTALAYLLRVQNSDGGWGFCHGEESNVFMTAVVSAALQQFPQVTSVATAEKNASTYLLNNQNADGGFGSPESTPYETALALSALVAVSGNTPALTSAFNHLVATQSGNGSWNDDPYSTALALKALYLFENRPSLPPPPAAGTITGVVVDAVTNVRVAGVAVSLSNNSLIGTTSDSSGRFTLSDVPPGAQGVAFSLTGYAAKAVTTGVLENTASDLGEVRLLSAYSTGTITGKVLDAGGAPLSDVTVTVSGAWSGSAATGADGSYSFSYVTPGTVALTAAKSGYQTVSASGSVAARTTLSFSPRLSTTASQVTTGTLVGRVVDSQWGLPIGHLPEEKGVTVTLSGGISVAVEPDTRGYFTIQGLAPNTYQATIGMNGMSTKTFRVIISAGVTTDLGTVALDWSLSEMALAGKITDARTGAPIVNATIDVADTMYSGITDFGGSYAIAGIPYPAEYRLRVHADNYFGKSFVVTASPGMHVIDVALEPEVTTGNLTGSVIDAASGAPLAGVSLSIGGDSPMGVSTAADGSFTITNAPKGVQKIDMALAGYSSRTLTTAISAGANNDVGKISLGQLPLPASVRGCVRDAAADAPFAGVRMEGTGSAPFNGSTDVDGNYEFSDVAPGTITVAATPAKAGYFGASLTAELAPAGVLVFSPVLSTTPPAGASLTVSTDKAAYQAGETVGMSVNVLNRVSSAATTYLSLRVTDPTGATAYASGAPVALPADGTAMQYFNFTLPALAQGGSYTVRAELFGESGALLGSGTGSFGISVSQITITPGLPAFFSVGESPVSFKLVNSGGINVASGVFEVRMTDPDGIAVFTAAQDFTLDTAQDRTLTFNVAVPELKFGTYTLSYTQKDETVAGRGDKLSLPNSVVIAARYDDASHRVRQEATLTATVINTGRFNLGAGNSMTVALPDAPYTESKSISAPAPGYAVGATLLYRFVIPETLSAGTHATRVTYALPSGSTSVHTAQLMIPESSITVSAPVSEVAAGKEIAAVFTNSGGVDTDVQYTLTLYDFSSKSLAVQTATGIVPAGGSLNAPVTVPAAALSGSYTLRTTFTDLKIQSTKIELMPLTVNGVASTLSAKTDKSTYLPTETITALSSIANAGGALQGGNLHLQVTTAGGSLQQKTWTSQYDFQQGTRNGVDTFETPDKVTLAVASDNFDDSLYDADRWAYSGWSDCPPPPPVETNGTLHLVMPQCLSGPDGLSQAQATNVVQLSGDFDASVDYNVISPWKSTDNQLVTLAVGTPYIKMEISQWRSPGYGATYGSRTIIDGVHTWNVSGNGATQGKLRIGRIGSTYTSYYWNGSGWTTHMTKTGPSGGDASVGIGSRMSTPSGVLDVKYDNFTIKTHVYPKSGTLTLRYDGGRSEIWRHLSYNAEIPQGTSISFRTRTAESQSGLSSSAWSIPFTQNDTPITSPAGRWIEVEVTLATSITNVTPVLHDLTVTQGSSPGEILWESDIPADVAAGISADVNKTVGTLGATGKLYLQGALTSASGQTVATSEYPFYIVSGNTLLTLDTDKKVYKPGEPVIVSGEVKNLAGADASALSLTVIGKIQGDVGQVIGTDSFSLPAGGSRLFTFTTTAGAEGVVDLQGSVTKDGNVLATSATRYEVAAPVVTASVTGPDTAGNSPFTMTLSLTNGGKSDVAVVVATSFGAPSQTVAVPAGRAVALQYQQQIAADTLFTFALSGDAGQTLKKFVAYKATVPDGSAAATIYADRIAYNPNEQATLSARITATEFSENLSALVTVGDANGRVVYSGTVSVATMNPGQTVGFNKYWNVGTAAPGNYRVVLQLADASGTVTASASCNLTINAPRSPKALLKGSVTIDKARVLSGETVTVGYGVTNVGNLDLSAVNLKLRTVGVADEVVYQSYSEAAVLAMGAAHTGTESVSTQNFVAKDYFVLLSADINGVEEVIGSGYFRVNGAPSAPALVAPAVGADVDTFTPRLVVSNAADPNDDRLTYQFEIYADSGLTSLVAATEIPETAGMTAWTSSAALAENRTYYWRCRANDGSLYGTWTDAAPFRVNTVNDPPTAPALSTPADGTAVAQLSPTLTVDNASDPDSANLTYNFEVALDPGFASIVASETGIAPGGRTTSWTLPVALEENATYYWRAQADDWQVAGPWSTGSFLVNTANDAPSTPVVTAPAAGSTVTALNASVTVMNSVDPDSPAVTYFYEADTVSTFDSQKIIRSGGIAAGDGTTTWNVTGLADNTRYYVRAKASDGAADSGWSDVVTFFVNTVNDPPTTPTLANPSNGAGVTVFSPALSVHKSADPDNDDLTYEFVVYADEAMTALVAEVAGVTAAGDTASWTVPVTLTENQTYYWRARAFDGSLHSDWARLASFMVNTANDAPQAPKAVSPVGGNSIATVTPQLVVENTFDPDNGTLSYDFEIYDGTALVAAVGGVPQGASGTTSATLSEPLRDNTFYQWRARAFDGDSYGSWSDMASFSIHLPQNSIGATVDIDPDTLNMNSNGTWIVARIEPAAGYDAAKIDISSIRLEGTVSAEPRPFALGDYDKDGVRDLMVKFRRSEVVKLLPAGERVPVHITGRVGEVAFEGMDIIRVIP